MAESLQLLWASHRGLTSGCLRAGFGDCDCSVRAEQTGQCGKARAIHQGHSQLTCITQQSLKSHYLGHYFFGDVVYGWVAAGLP